MRRIVGVTGLAWLLVGVTLAHGQAGARGTGHLVIIGGGTIPDDVRARTLELGGGPKAIVAIFPQASELPETGPETVAIWKKAGAAEAISLDAKDPTACIAAVKRATLIWFPGGDQTKLTAALEPSGIAEAIRQRYREGVTVAGTSAGAAVMTKVMITGNEMDMQAITAGKTDTAPGFGLWPRAIVDQHFLKRQRSNRLISAVLDHPELVGVGIDESTAVVVTGSEIEVIGKSSVVVFDARKASVTPTPAGQPITGRNLTMHVLKAGMKLDLGPSTRSARSGQGK
jgi:cyanophycinase